MVKFSSEQCVIYIYEIRTKERRRKKNKKKECAVRANDHYLNLIPYE